MRARRRDVRFRQLLVFALVVAVLAVNALVSYRAAHTLQNDYGQVSHTHRVLATIQKIDSELTDAETAQRGFIITGQDGFVAPYRGALDGVEEAIRQFNGLTTDNPVQRRRLPELRQLVDRRIASLQKGIELRRNGDNEGARAFVQSGQGRLERDALRRLLLAIDQEEERLLRLRDVATEKSAQRLYLTISIASVAAVLFVILASVFNQRDLRARERARVDLQRSNDELERRVRQRTAELDAANAELGRSNRELQDFAFVASHDLQEPLRKIQAFGDLLRGEYGEKLGAEGRDFIDRMQKAARRMHALIRDLLDYSRVATRVQPFSRVDLGIVTGEVLEDLQTRIAENGGRVEVGSMPTLDADPLQMRQLMQNMVGNALKFSRPGIPPLVTVEGYIESGLDGSPVCRIRVEDNGIGFDPKYADRIFTPFQRLHPGRQYEGTGMGLAVCRRIAERHGGEITATSVPGQGSVFLVSIPAEHPESGQPTEAATRGGAPS
jgi:signal transduction histidine kinase